MRLLSQHAVVAGLTLMRYSTLVAAKDYAQPLQSFLEAQSITVVHASSTPTGASHGALDTESSQVALAFNQVRDRCPANCSDTGSDPRNWTVYHKTDRLMRCDQTMLLDFSLYNQLNDPKTHMTIRSCTANLDPADVDEKLPVTNSCAFTTHQQHVNTSVQLASWGSPSNAGVAEEAVKASQQIEALLSQNDAICNETINFAFSGLATVGLYAGSQINGQGVALSMLNQFISHVHNEGMPETLVAQLCADSGRNSKYSMGIIATTNTNLTTVQDAVKTWKNGKCLSSYDLEMTWQNITFHAPALQKVGANSTRTSVSTSTAVHPLTPRSTCSTAQVASGDSCASLAAECGITPAQFTKYNPSSTLCSTLQAGEYVCCSAGTLPDRTPKPNPDGSCATHLVVSGDTCSAIAASNSITTANIEKYNTQTWGWMGCTDLQIGNYICLSTGAAPVPAPVANAVCGPQVNGTVAKPGANMTLLNTCPLNACCDIWGQCGTTSEFCTESKSSTGAPGTAAPGHNGCISNCGTEIISYSAPPEEFRKVGYFEAYDWQRPCLQMDVLNVNTSSYTHLHLSFATLNPDFSINVTGIQDQFDAFVSMTGVQRVISFGGWEFSTSAATYDLFREAVRPANRATFTNNVISFLNDHNLDGLDFDWEYPGEPDIPGIPASSEEDVQNLADFMTALRRNMTAHAFGKTLAVTAPASWWYLKNIPIDVLAQASDYVVYMTYDLHGQWDYGSAFSDTGCPKGNCLRSHVNLTETLNALSMITKAGVLSTKVVVGVSSYGRSFQMTTPGCHTEMCTYTGPESGAIPGKCTQTAGYLAQAEINEIIASSSTGATLYMDEESYSNIMVYDSTQWVAYMDEENKRNRTSLYQGLNFGGVADWAVDLQSESGSAGSNGDGDGEEGGEVYLPPDFWGSESPIVRCAPPCTLIPPPIPLATPTTIQWPSYVTPIAVQGSGGGVSTVTKTYSVHPFSLGHIPVWPITIKPGDPTSQIWQPVQSIHPPPFTVILPGTEAPVPPKRFPGVMVTTSTTTTTSGVSSSTSGPTSTSSGGVIFHSTSHPVTMQPQPTISWTFSPPVTTPTATFSSTSGSASPTATRGCNGCGDYNCELFGCNGGCGLLGCEGGCGIFGCGGGCSIQGCGDSDGNGDSGGCSLSDCGGPDCATGKCGNLGCPNGDCSSLSSVSCEAKTASVCAEYCTVATNTASMTTTSCTSSSCFLSVGCEPTGKTVTITSTSEASCPTITSAVPGCKPCSWAYMALDSPIVEDNLMIRAAYEPTPVHIEKRAPETSISKIATTCSLSSKVTMPAYTGPNVYLASAVANNLPDSQKMSRWYSKTTSNCAPVVTLASDAHMEPLLNDPVNNPTIEHVYEKNWLDGFWTYLLGGSDWSCTHVNDLFFPTCDQNRLQSIYDGIAGDSHWDFIGMTGELNGRMKGVIGGKYDETVVAKSETLRSKIVQARVPWSRARITIGKELDFLGQLALGCSIWSSNYVFGPLDTTNNRIYSAVHAIDTDLATIYMDWLTNVRISGMMEATKTQIDLLIQDIGNKLSISQTAAMNTDDGINEWTDLQNALQATINTYNLDKNDASHPCLKPIDLSWTLSSSTTNSRRQSDISKRDTCTYKTFEIYQEVPQNQSFPGNSDGTYWAGFDLSLEQGNNADYLCDSGYQVVGPVPWNGGSDTAIPGSLGPFELDQGKYTGCKYNGGGFTGNGTLSCNGDYHWDCSLVEAYNVGIPPTVTCDDFELYLTVYCSYALL